MLRSCLNKIRIHPFIRTFSVLTVEDSSRRGLYYHLLSDKPSSKFAVSFLSTPPKSRNSRTILGFLAGDVGDEQHANSDEAGLDDFNENAGFLDLLHDTLKDALTSDNILLAQATQLQHGWMHINDDRNLPPLGRIAGPDDIIASVRVENGQVVPATYQPMPTYRVCTTDGLLQLPHGLMDRLLDKLRQQDQIDQQSS